MESGRLKKQRDSKKYSENLFKGISIGIGISRITIIHQIKSKTKGEKKTTEGRIIDSEKNMKGTSARRE